ncbi:hypothetical protein FPV67DRAFT_1416506 [Lyophyllum atratum]|nr:hypothetical protein FPV67DRAFT_1416506 [Lyophyllum atratum]
MFKFDFALDDADIDPEFAIDAHLARVHITPDNVTTPAVSPGHAFTELPIEELLERLPSVISYSPLVIPIIPVPVPSPTPAPQSSPGQVTLVRRDLFDARYQLIAPSNDDVATKNEEEKEREREREDGLAFVEAPSDLVPGVYEGGLKTWECSVDLGGWLAGGEEGDVRGKRVLEIGCGTAVPSMCLLCRLFSSDPPDPDEKETQIHLQDYNPSVLELVSFPNLLLTWYMSPAAAPVRASSASASASSATTTTAEPAPDPSTPGELPITPLLKSAFLKALAAYRIQLRFFAGAWEAFDVPKALPGGDAYDVVVTSETIYRTESVPALLGLMRRAGGGAGTCFVAAKVVYFGVGGGVNEFVGAVQEEGGRVEGCWEGGVGVGRRVLRVRW